MVNIEIEKQRYFWVLHLEERFQVEEQIIVRANKWLDYRHTRWVFEWSDSPMESVFGIRYGNEMDHVKATTERKQAEARPPQDIWPAGY